jgi:hypothetical protein
MKCEIEHYGNGWSEISIEITKNEIDRMIELLRMIKSGMMDHFHIVSKFEGKPGIADIEIRTMDEDEKSNMILD